MFLVTQYKIGAYQKKLSFWQLRIYFITFTSFKSFYIVTFITIIIRCTTYLQKGLGEVYGGEKQRGRELLKFSIRKEVP